MRVVAKFQGCFAPIRFTPWAMVLGKLCRPLLYALRVLGHEGTSHSQMLSQVASQASWARAAAQVVNTVPDGIWISFSCPWWT